MDIDSLTDKQLNDFTVIERACSVLSLLGCIFIIGTFSASKSFHKPINRLVFYASFGNLMTNVGTLMARSYLSNVLSAGCQFQAFIIQWFMPADTFWTLAMAINVYLTFYYKFDAQKIRRMEIPYLIGCYGIPFIVALTYLFVRTQSRGRVFGNATLWCWISSSWDIWRITTFYAPIWIVILVTFFIYIRAGREIYKKHRQLRSMNQSSHRDTEPQPITNPFNPSKTTEVFVTTEIVNIQQPQGIDLAPLGRRDSECLANLRGMRGNASALTPQSEASAAGQRPRETNNAAYSVMITSNKRPDNEADDSNLDELDDDMDLPIQDENGSDTQSDPRTLTANPSLDRAMTGERGTTSSGPTFVKATPAPRRTINQRLRRRAAYEANSAAWSYAKCALLFFTAMLVTWIPSSANRVFSVVHPGQVNLALEYMSAFVLPLQGFWNAIIYMVTSWSACKMLWDDIVGGRWPLGTRSSPGPLQNSQLPHATGHYERQSRFGARAQDGGSAMAVASGLSPSKAACHGSSNDSDEMLHKMGAHSSTAPKSEKSYESESMTELADMRPSREN